ncbi:hypothetical protein ABPG72_008506 [Tetrahymena utriculariae]
MRLSKRCLINLRICSVFPFKNEISSVSVVNNQLKYIGFSHGSIYIGKYSCSSYIYINDYCNTQNTIFNPYLKKAYLFNYSKIIVVDLYSKSDTILSYGHPTTNSVNVIQDSINGNMITYSKESTQNLYKFNQKNQTSTQFLNGHNTTVDYVFLDIQNDVVISHSISLTDLKVIVWSYSYTIQLQVFLNIFQFYQVTPIIKNEIIVTSPIPQLQKISPSNNWIVMISTKLLTIIDRFTHKYKSTILCNTNCGDYKISDKLNLIFSYLRDNSVSVDTFDIKKGNYLYSISGQTDLDI